MTFERRTNPLKETCFDFNSNRLGPSSRANELHVRGETHRVEKSNLWWRDTSVACHRERRCFPGDDDHLEERKHVDEWTETIRRDLFTLSIIEMICSSGWTPYGRQNTRRRNVESSQFHHWLSNTAVSRIRNSLNPPNSFSSLSLPKDWLGSFPAS